MNTTFAIFDVDYTLIDGDSMFLMMFFGIRKRPFLTLYLPIIFIKMLLYFFNIIDTTKAKESIYIPLKFLSNEEIKEFYNNILIKKVYPEIMDIIKSHKEEGRRILLVSSSPEVYLKYFEENQYVDHVIGTKLKKVNGKYTNKVYGKNCKGFEKVNRINQYLKEIDLKIDFKSSFAYSDSIEDKPMLEMVKNKYKVCKGKVSMLD